MTRKTKVVLGFVAVAVIAAGVIWAGIYRSAVGPKRLVGTWTFVNGANIWGETRLRFGEDGKMQMTSQWVGKSYDSEGTYTVKGNTIEMLMVDESDWGEAAWGNRTTKGGGGKSNTDAKSKPQSQPKKQQRTMQRRMTIKSLSETELVVADERGKRTVYARK
jgi:uncharacterized protein (TIGR03066 family)